MGSWVESRHDFTSFRIFGHKYSNKQFCAFSLLKFISKLFKGHVSITGKGSSRQDHPNHAPSQHASEKDNLLSSPKHGNGKEEDDPSLATVVKLIETFRAETRCSMGTLQSTMHSSGARLTAIETSLQDFDDRISALEAKCETHEKSNKLLIAKMEDLESRSKCQNLRVSGMLENLDGPQVTAFKTTFFAETLGMDIPDGPEMLDRARRLASRPSSGQNTLPRLMIVRVNHFRVKQRILQLAREKGQLIFRRHPMHIYPDFTPEIAKRRASYSNIKAKLQATCIQYGLLFPTRLQVSFNGGKHIFTTPGDVEKFFMETISPTLRADRADNADG